MIATNGACVGRTGSNVINYDYWFEELRTKYTAVAGVTGANLGAFSPRLDS